MSCGLKGLGQTCAAGAECASTMCVDGLCCNEACDGPCRSCSLASSMGICKNVAAGAADPRNTCQATDPSTCGTDGMCDGNGACRRFAAGTTCTMAGCSGSTRMLAGRCDSQGNCAAGATLSCTPYLCNGAACFTACGSDADCLAPNVCIGGACGLRASGMPCTTGTECGSGYCTDGVCCETNGCGTCQACNLTSSPGRCAPVAMLAADPHGRCADQGAMSCGTDGKCDGAGSCHQYAAGTGCGGGGCSGITLTLPSSCDGNGACVPGGQQTCAPYACGASGCLSTCATNADCAPPTQCNGGSCGPKPLGAACGADGDCASGHCTDGVCCDSGACTSCRACNVTGKAGTCQPVAAGAADPRAACVAQAAATCGRNGACDGSGGCQLQLAGTVCSPAVCNGNSAVPASLCDGSGVCMPPTGGGNGCGLYACENGMCVTACSSDADCVAPATCAGAVCRKKPLGASCGAGSDCDSNSCVDGVCCSSSSCGSCTACNVPGFLGTCSNVAAGAADPHARCTASTAASCGLDGACDGAGACRHWVAGTPCAAATCIAKKQSQNPKTCDGAGTCTARGMVTCAPDDCVTTTGKCP
jgi:hypothetical protein